MIVRYFWDFFITRISYFRVNAYEIISPESLGMAFCTNSRLVVRTPFSVTNDIPPRGESKLIVWKNGRTKWKYILSVNIASKARKNTLRNRSEEIDSPESRMKWRWARYRAIFLIWWALHRSRAVVNLIKAYLVSNFEVLAGNIFILKGKQIYGSITRQATWGCCWFYFAGL